MKKTTLLFAATGLLFGSLVSSCKSNSDKEADAEKNVTEAKEDMKDAQEETKVDKQIKANDADWQTYKKEALITVAKNEDRIAELKAAMKQPGTKFDANYAKSIDDLETKNNRLKTRIANYENNQTDWDSFKRDFNADMVQLGDAIKNIGTPNKK